MDNGHLILASASTPPGRFRTKRVDLLGPFTIASLEGWLFWAWNADCEKNELDRAKEETILLASPYLCCASLLIAAQALAGGAAAQVDARAEVAAALYAASATQAAAERAADAKTRTQRGEIERLQAQFR